MKTVVKQSAEAQAIRNLREHLIAGHFPPGARLTEMRLATELGVARATIRTALNHLAQERLIVRSPYRGWAVAELGWRDAWELYTLRASLESLASRLAASEASEADRRSLETIMSGLTDASTEGAMAKAMTFDFKLHKTIVKISGHRRLAEHYRIAEQQIRVCVAWSDCLLQSAGSLVEQHQPIVDAILRPRRKQPPPYPSSTTSVKARSSSNT